MKKIKLALFFTLGISIHTWEKMGYLSRESRIYKCLASHLGEVYFLTYGARDKTYEEEIAPIKVFPKPPGIPAKLYSFLMPFIHWRTLKKVDIFKTNQMNGAWAAVLAKLLFKKKLVVRCGYEWKITAIRSGVNRLKLALIHAIEWFCYRFADAVILTSEEMRRYVTDTFGISSEKITVIPNYVDTDLFRPMNIDKVPKRLIYVGRFAEEKNLLNLLKAIKDLPEIELVLVGNGPLESFLQGFARKHNINVVFKGRVPNEQLPLLLNTAEIFILPSFYEGNPKALLEAMACGILCIGTNVVGIREIIKDGYNGFLINGMESKNIIETIKRAFDIDDDMKKNILKNARTFVVRKFSVENIDIVEKNIFINLNEKL